MQFAAGAFSLSFPAEIICLAGNLKPTSEHRWIITICHFWFSSTVFALEHPTGLAKTFSVLHSNQRLLLPTQSFFLLSLLSQVSDLCRGLKLSFAYCLLWPLSSQTFLPIRLAFLSLYLHLLPGRSNTSLNTRELAFHTMHPTVTG